MYNALSVSVIIPTKNRPSDLQQAARSVFAQTVLPLSLIIVDQSPDDESRRRVEAELAAAEGQRGPLCKLYYIRDPAISGAAMARNRAMEVADGDVWLFLDDDVVLEPDFVEQLLIAYRDHPAADGISGIITNYPRASINYRIWRTIFIRGPFRDERQPIYWRANQLRSASPIRVRRFTGCVMSFRADAVRGRLFDTNLRGVSDGEDVDFCIQLGPQARLFIAPGARLEHRHSPSGRPLDHWLRRSVRGNVFLYLKNWNNGIFNRLSYGWLLVGFSLAAVMASTRGFSSEPCRALRMGLQDGHETMPGSHLARSGLKPLSAGARGPQHSRARTLLRRLSRNPHPPVGRAPNTRASTPQPADEPRVHT